MWLLPCALSIQARLYPHQVGWNLLFIRSGNEGYTWLIGLNSDASLEHFSLGVPYPPEGLTGIAIHTGKLLHPTVPVRDRGACEIEAAWGRPSRNASCLDFVTSLGCSSETRKHDFL